MISAAEGDSKGSEEFGFLDTEFFEQSNVSYSFLPIEVKYS